MYEFFKKLLNFHTTWYLGVFGIADYESVFRFQKFKMADPIWRMALFKINQIRLKLVTRRFSESLIANLYSDFKHSKWRIQYDGQLFLKSIESTWSLLLGGFRGSWNKWHLISPQKQMTAVSVADDVVRVKVIVVIRFCEGNSCHLTTRLY